MIVVHRFRVPVADRPGFAAVADPAVGLLSTRDGLLSLDFGVNLDDPTLSRSLTPPSGRNNFWYSKPN